MRWWMATALTLALLAGACSKVQEIESQRAVRAAIDAHLKQQKNLSVSNMKMDIQSLRVQGDSAEADVRFTSAQQPDLGVNVHYTLRRTGNQWEVVSSSSGGGMGGNPHGSAMPAAPGGQQPAANPQPQPSH